jgi:hypothetical protein
MLAMLACVRGLAMCGIRMMACLFVIARVVVSRSFVVMMRGALMVLRGLAMMLGCLF